MKNLIYLVGDIVSRQCVEATPPGTCEGGRAGEGRGAQDAGEDASGRDHHGIVRGSPREHALRTAMVHGPTAGKLAKRDARERLCGMYEMRQARAPCTPTRRTSLRLRATSASRQARWRSSATLRHAIGRAGLWTVLHTPGPARSIWSAWTRAGARSPRAVVTGDTIFPRSTRPLWTARTASDRGEYDSVRALRARPSPRRSPGPLLQRPQVHHWPREVRLALQALRNEDWMFGQQPR